MSRTFCLQKLCRERLAKNPKCSFRMAIREFKCTSEAPQASKFRYQQRNKATENLEGLSDRNV